MRQFVNELMRQLVNLPMNTLENWQIIFIFAENYDHENHTIQQDYYF